MLRGRSSLRAAALLAAGGMALHQLRYALGGAGGGVDASAGGGHEYLHALVPVIAALLTLAAGHFIAVLAGSARGPESEARRSSLPRLWVLATLALLAIYAGQELVEGMVVHRGPGGMAALFGTGGWSALPLSVAIGLLVALVERGAEAAIAAVSRRTPVVGGARAVAPSAARSVDLLRGRVLARKLASRAPPVPSV